MLSVLDRFAKLSTFIEKQRKIHKFFYEIDQKKSGLRVGLIIKTLYSSRCHLRDHPRFSMMQPPSFTKISSSSPVHVNINWWLQLIHRYIFCIESSLLLNSSFLILSQVIPHPRLYRKIRYFTSMKQTRSIHYEANGFVAHLPISKSKTSTIIERLWHKRFIEHK